MSVSHERDAYKSREYTSGERNLIALHVQFVQSNPLKAGWRGALKDGLGCFKDPPCRHVERHLVELATPYGIWAHEICAECGEHLRRECPHVRLTWQNDGTALICDNCGVDGT